MSAAEFVPNKRVTGHPHCDGYALSPTLRTVGRPPRSQYVAHNPHVLHESLLKVFLESHLSLTGGTVNDTVEGVTLF